MRVVLVTKYVGNPKSLTTFSSWIPALMNAFTGDGLLNVPQHPGPIPRLHNRAMVSKGGTGALFFRKPVDPTKIALTVKPETSIMTNSFFSFNPLKFVLASLGIPVGQLVESSQKCVAELGPEAVGAVKTLLVMWAPRHLPCTGTTSQSSS
ncbi:Secretoglobin family 3A member 1 [Galemys pyrenaicus]|uniref:Secretoglobin family 3A member 1 n=1 Tax=Galemys pyrenaicus TaxID=202257 RepID=A0A8J6BH45_GALPY|nr:Secretoglobin family 3A member 1 [Galemys pyrenaicus]